MNILPLIQAKRRGLRLTDAEIEAFIQGVTSGAVPDYQTSALLMAICFAGMDEDETLSLTRHMASSGRTLDLSPLPGIKADKHSTGGVGDKTTLILGPLAAACGLTFAKLAGRGLGITGGTIDKLESIPGFNAALSSERFIEVLAQTGLCVASQSDDLVPADRVLYELRGVTGTVESIPLIAASVMSKKLAAGAQCILLDVKRGDGAFMKTPQEAQTLADTMAAIGRGAGLSCHAVVTDMDAPLGNAVGNALEVTEALEVLHGRGPSDLTECCLQLGAHLLDLAAQRGYTACPATERRQFLAQKLTDGSAYRCFLAMVSAQGGDVAALERGLPQAPALRTIKAAASGTVTRIDAGSIGLAAGLLGAGRTQKGGDVDPTAGMIFCKKPGDTVIAGQTLCELHAASEARLDAAEPLVRSHIVIE